MNRTREQTRQLARTYATEQLRLHGSVSLRTLALHTSLSRVSLVDLMTELQALGVASLTETRGTYQAGPKVRYQPCSDEHLQTALMEAIQDRPSCAGLWSDVLLTEHIQRSRDDVRRSLVTLEQRKQLDNSYVGGLIISRQPRSRVS